MTEQEARAAFEKLDLTELRKYAEQEGIPYAGLGNNEIIDALLGHCPKCKGGKMTVIYEGNHHQNNIYKPAGQQECLECQKNK